MFWFYNNLYRLNRIIHFSVLDCAYINEVSSKYRSSERPTWATSFRPSRRFQTPGWAGCSSSPPPDWERASRAIPGGDPADRGRNPGQEGGSMGLLKQTVSSLLKRDE